MFEESFLCCQRGTGIPVHHQLARCNHRLILRLCDYPDEVLAHHHLREAWKPVHRMLIYIGDRRTHLWRPNHAAVEHAGYMVIVDKLKLAGHQRDSVQRGNWLPQHSPLRFRSSRRCCAQGKVEMLAPDQLFILDPASRAPNDDAIVQPEFINRLAQLFRSQAKQSLSCRRRRKSEIFRIEVGWCCLAARCGALIRSHRGIAFNQLHPRDRYAQFLCDQLRLRGKDALAKIALPGIGGDGAIGTDCQPGVKFGWINMRAMGSEYSLSARAEVHDQGATAL